MCQNNTLSPLPSCQPTDFSSTKHFHRKDPANFLFPWPHGGGGRPRVSLCQMLWKRGVYKSAPTCIGDSQLRTSKSALAVSLQAGQHLTVFVQNWCCFLTPNDKKTNMLQDVLSAFILHPCWTLAMKPTYQEEMIGDESLCLFSASLYAVEITTLGSWIFARRIKNILSTNNWILWVSKFEKKRKKSGQETK